MKRLGDFSPQILDDDEKHDGYLRDINQINLDTDLPPVEVTYGDGLTKDTELDQWWNSIIPSNKSLQLSSVLEACLSVFSGPMIEGTFPIMNDNMNKRRNSLNTETYDGIMNVKMHHCDLHNAAARHNGNEKKRCNEYKGKVKDLGIKREALQPKKNRIFIKEIKPLERQQME